MQKLVQEQNEKSETVNRERKYHQVIQLSCVPFHIVVQYCAAFWSDEYAYSFESSAQYCIWAYCIVHTMEGALS